jgi:hypothetical protein
MRISMALAVLLLTACANERLAQAPPAGVDFSGHWKLNEADSDNPQRMLQTQFDQPAAGPGTPSTGGRGGRQGGGRGGAAGGVPMIGGPGGPIMPSVGALGESLRWPGRQLEVKQVAGVVAFTSEGVSRVCQPMDAGKTHRHHDSSGRGDGGSSARDAAPRARDASPPHCGWADKTLIVQGGDPEDEHASFEEHYSLSEDRQRLVEVVGFVGGRSRGFTMSRVWDRTQQ